MTFSITSFTYMAFLAVALTVYYLVRPAYQLKFLLVVSLIFYVLAGEPYTILYLAVSTVSVYRAAIRVSRTADAGRAKKILIWTLILNFGLLLILKYNGFLLDNVNWVRSLFGLEEAALPFRIIASLGISYYTLQLTGYLLDVYWKVGAVQEDFVKFALFACYFPQMTSGPISRYKQVRESLYAEHAFDYDRVVCGLRRMAFGMFEKMVIADRLGMIVDSVYNHYTEYNAILIWMGILCFSLQLYTDFAGCINIVLGTSECFGIRLPENFRNPFFSTTIQEFWQRWHITLGTWLKDYIMDPVLKSPLWIRLGEYTRTKFGKKWGKRIPTYLGMLVLWLAMGMWHGSGWKFIVGEGLWFWLAVIFGNMFSKELKSLTQLLHINPKNILWITFQRLRTFLIFSLGLICFRAQNMGETFALLKAGFTQFGERGFSQIRGDLGTVNLCMLCVAFPVLLAAESAQNREVDLFAWVAGKPALLRWCLYLFFCGMVLLSLSISGQSFIYAGF